MILLTFDRPRAAFLFITVGYWCCCHSSIVRAWNPSPVVVRSVALAGSCRTIGPNSHQHSMRKHVIVSLARKEMEDATSSREERQQEEAASDFQMETGATRRDILSTVCGCLTVATTGTVTGLPSAVVAAEPVNAKDTDSVLAIAKRKLRPKPPKLLRRKLSQDFAVLMMRSAYNALDDMDCVAMDQFQRDFFLIRLAEYETYTKNLGDGMVKQGDLTDPYYFDFISFAQYKTINREVTQDPPYIFEEQQIPAEGSDIPSMKPNGTAQFIPVIVKRDPKLTNKMLIPTHRAMVGKSILDKLELTFGETEVKIPDLGYRPDSIALLSGLRKIVNIFLINGYAFKGEVASVAGSGTSGALATYTVSLSAPATLWSGKVLQVEGDPLNNDFVLVTLNEYIKRCGYVTTKSTIKYDGANEDITITVR